MQNGDIILFKVNNFKTWYRWLLAKLIQLFDRTYYHHCALVIGNEIHEAENNGIIRNPIEKYAGSNYVVLRPIEPLTDTEKGSLLVIANNQIGKPYDYWGTLFFQLIYKFTRIWFGPSGKSSQSKLYCSEHCVLAYHLLRGWYRKYYTVSPGDILRSSGYFKVVKEGVL